MARRKARISGKKFQPAVKTLAFNFQEGGAGGGTDYISLSQCASLVNRRFYRAGLNWAVSGFTIITTGGAGNIFISKVPDTWVASNAWHKGFAHWNELNNRALEAAETVKAKFTDFKVYMDPDHHAAGVAANLLPVDVAGNPYVAGEWEMFDISIADTSNIPSSATNQYEFVWTGTNYPGAGASGKDAVSLIEGYAASRLLPDINDPNTPTDARRANGPTPENWLTAIDNEGTNQLDDVITDLTTSNDQAPYPYENDGVHTDTMYPGGANQAPGVEIHDIVGVSATTIGNVTKVAGSNFQGGLIRIDNTLTGGSGNQLLLVHLVPGDHRGYLCQPMQDV